MKLLYIANARIPTEKAHGLQIMKMCESFSSLEAENEKLEVELILPRRINPIKIDPFIYYGVNKSFKIKYLPVLDLVCFGRLGFWIESLFFSYAALFYVLFQKAEIIYGRDELPLYFLSFFSAKGGKNIFFEAHQGRINVAARRLFKKAGGIITISRGLKDFYVKRGAKSEKIIVAPDAVDFAVFNVSFSKEECRRKLNLPLDKKIVLYTGHLYKWKGADTLLKAAKLFQIPGSGFQEALFVFVGGTDKDISVFKEKSLESKNILIAGHRPYLEIPLWLKAVDILVLPNSGKEEISRRFTSPLKLFEYMASGTPIVASDLPSIREILNDNLCTFFKPDDPADLADKIKFAVENYESLKIKADSASELVKNYTWDKRAASIAGLISGIVNNWVKADVQTFKSDFWPALFAGLGIAILSLPIFKNISVFDAVFSASRGFAYGLFAFWLAIIPAGAVSGTLLARRIGRKKPVIFELAKYGLVGWLNVFMNAGIFNFMAWLTGITKGLLADFFLVISFAITTTNAFFWNKFWTFGAYASKDGKREYAAFFTVSGLTALLNTAIFHLIVNVIGAPAGFNEKIWANIAIFVLIPVSLFGNFFGYKIFVFKRKNSL
ncbi:MAG: glycosyltransferase [Patescibacteria group bacterium]